MSDRCSYGARLHNVTSGTVSGVGVVWEELAARRYGQGAPAVAM
jgi:hypothetical protein